MSGKDLYNVKCNIHEKALDSSCQHKQKFNIEKERQSAGNVFQSRQAVNINKRPIGLKGHLSSI